MTRSHKRVARYGALVAVARGERWMLDAVQHSNHIRMLEAPQRLNLLEPQKQKRLQFGQSLKAARTDVLSS